METDGVSYANDALCTGALENGLTCLFPHSHLISTYNFAVGRIVQFKVRAHNINGWSTWSQLNSDGAHIMQEPMKMATPTEGSQTTFDSIEVLWTALTTLEETGGTLSIHSYNLEMYGEPTNVW